MNRALFFIGMIVAAGCLAAPAWGSGTIEIPAGPAVLGGGTDSAARAEGIVSLDTFYIDAYEVTNAEFAFVFPGHPFPPGSEDQPVSEVPWQDANAYCEISGKRLPTEAEWEKAARGVDGRTYPWGEQLPRQHPHPYHSGLIKRNVGHDRLDISPFGAHDMAGSVWEWTADRIDHKAVVRGGLWNLHLDYEYSKTFDRNLIPADQSFSFLGFRCARSE
ncbi:MAG: hypothetical protein COV67_07755 [Nitrospinae bacterium CG11_big_fil_rev_8_21_14_0_20_56_8]|nr:MAG: hypothetical protein COV67_07755 [Nitrospinae bacterium CG11_big_fil_rev_8_21_14_0_20_56_8]